MWTPANTSLAWWTAALWLHSPHSASELGESFADLRGHQAYQSGLKKGDHDITRGQRKMYFFLFQKCFVFFPQLILESGNCIFVIYWCVWDTHFFSPYTLSNCRAMAGLDKSQSVCWDILWPPKLQDLWCYVVSHILMPPYPLRHARWQSSVLCGGWLFLALWLELSIMQVVGLRKGKQEIFL